MNQPKKTWIITGISSGFGHLLSAELMHRGDFVIGTFRNQNQVDAFNQLNVGKGVAYKLDVAFPEQIDHFYHELQKRFDNIDVLVNNAGNGLLGAIEEVNLEEARLQMETNFFGALNMTQQVLPMMRKQGSGHIVQISSMAGFLSTPGCGLYNASKFALEGFSEALAIEVEPFNIKVIIIEPGPFRTDFCETSLKTAAHKIADYESSVGSVAKHIHEQHGKQVGDPQKAIEAIIQAVRSDHPPLRLPLGQIAFNAMLHKMESVKKDLETWQEVSFQTSFEGMEMIENAQLLKVISRRLKEKDQAIRVKLEDL